eukprot:CAMPEP_0119126700 /NCGR_PEP_ID=MMETSP1310-20130426/5520_1 /TAXON_ID=464262 /ORGANISM="Genus nov. species nov., Strain RCC2339" /LENGTH=774 /DNA_ID=CAMNT_0007116871 /DNA_START=325 /DNA_END=2649 /DNA_ORIENTATION=+
MLFLVTILAALATVGLGSRYGGYGGGEPAGLFMEGQSGRKISVPMRSMEVSADVVGTTATVSMVQEFSMPSSDGGSGCGVASFYSLPLDEMASVTEFKAEVSECVIYGTVKERAAARAEYEQAVRAGYNAYLAEQTRPDIFQLSVGNLPTDTVVRVTLTYVTELETEDGDTRFVFPTAIAPRYVPADDSQRPLPGGKDLLNRGLRVRATAALGGGAVAARSPTHNLNIELSDDGERVSVGVEGPDVLARDIVILFAPHSGANPRAIVEQAADGTYVGMVSFVPEPPMLSGAVMPPTEYIFLLDCSGSMDDGNKIGQLRQAMLTAMRELPDASLFNLVSFGDRYTALFGASTPKNTRSYEKAVQYVRALRGDMGGTEILPALRDVLQGRPLVPGYRRAVFVMTDGQVSNTDDVINLVSSRSHEAVVSALGIGPHASRNLVQGVARGGGGTADFSDGVSADSLVAAVRRQLDAVGQAVPNVRISWAGLGVQAPGALRPLVQGKRFTAYYLFEGPTGSGEEDVGPPDTIRIEAGDGIVDLRVEVEQVWGEVIHKLAARERIRDLEEHTVGLLEEGTFASREEITAEVARLGVHYQIASSQTSFIAVDRGQCSPQLCEPGESPAVVEEKEIIREESALLEFKEDEAFLEEAEEEIIDEEQYEEEYEEEYEDGYLEERAEAIEWDGEPVITLSGSTFGNGRQYGGSTRNFAAQNRYFKAAAQKPLPVDPKFQASSGSRLAPGVLLGKYTLFAGVALLGLVGVFFAFKRKHRMSRSRKLP